MSPVSDASRTLGRVDALAATPDTSRLRRGVDVQTVATEFEAVMLQELVRSMRATTTADGREPQSDQMTEHLIDEAMAGQLARSGGIGLASYIVGGEVTDHSRFSPDETLKFQGRMSVDSVEHRLRFVRQLPSNDDQNGSTPASFLPGDTIEENDLR